LRKDSVTGGNYRYFFDCINVGADQCVCPKNRVNYFDYDESTDSLLQNNTPICLRHLHLYERGIKPCRLSVVGGSFRIPIYEKGIFTYLFPTSHLSICFY